MKKKHLFLFFLIYLFQLSYQISFQGNPSDVFYYLSLEIPQECFAEYDDVNHLSRILTNTTLNTPQIALSSANANDVECAIEINGTYYDESNHRDEMLLVFKKSIVLLLLLHPLLLLCFRSGRILRKGTL